MYVRIDRNLFGHRPSSLSPVLGNPRCSCFAVQEVARVKVVAARSIQLLLILFPIATLRSPPIRARD
jgi:hypothetical protein